MSYITKAKELILEALFPPVCLNCRKLLENQRKETGICSVCLSKIIIHTSLFCPICRARFPENKKICHKNSAYLLGAAANYDGPVKNLIHQLKYNSWRRLENPIKNIMGIYLKNLDFNAAKLKNFLVIPIPLHKNRKHSRGFNQAEIIGKIISDYWQLPIETGILTRGKETESQINFKNWGQRKNNLTGAFKITNPKKIGGKNIILVDDVYTSGATIGEAAKTLRSAGVKKIIALVLAKAR